MYCTIYYRMILATRLLETKVATRVWYFILVFLCSWLLKVSTSFVVVSAHDSSGLPFEAPLMLPELHALRGEGSCLPCVSPSYTWAQEYAVSLKNLGGEGVATWFRSRNQLWIHAQRYYPWILSPELRRGFGKVLGTQNRPTFRLAFICIIWINLTITFINQTLNMHAVISNRLTNKDGKDNMKYSIWRNIKV